MAKFPALPVTVDRYVREFLNRLAGRSGNAGDKAVLHSELAKLGLAKEKGQRLSLPATTVGSITDTLEPVNPAELLDNPTTPEGLSAAGIMGAIILQWQPTSYKGHNLARKVREVEKEIKVLKKGYGAASAAQKKKLGEEIDKLEAIKAGIKSEKEGPTETLVRPVEGYEAICPGTRMTSGIDITRANDLDLGFVLYALKEISKRPFVGAHGADGKGEFALDWEVKTWSDDQEDPVPLGRVKVGLLDFEIIPENGLTTLQHALDKAQGAFADPKKYGLDFSAFNPMKTAALS